MKHASVQDLLTDRFAAAVAAVAESAPGEINPVITPARDPRFGDYQCNVAMSLAKRLKSPPRDVAERIKTQVEPTLAEIAEPLEIAGPGFLNIRLRNEFLSRCLCEIPPPPPAGSTSDEPKSDPRPPAAAQLDRLGMPPVAAPQRVVIDYSSPNIAKQMHVGHIRSTIIGDVFARVLSFEGHTVVRQNHIGDWGTQFGMLIAHYAEKPLPTSETCDDVLDAIEDDYRRAQERFKSDASFAETARANVGRLQSGDAEARRIWEQICAASRAEFLDIYQRLNVLLVDADVCGESFYNDRLAPAVAELRARLTDGGGASSSTGERGILRDDQGAACIFLEDAQGKPLYKNAAGEPLPMIIQKSDGAFIYATTDLAALRYRVEELKADRIIYVTDARQKLHFEMLFATARAAGWAGHTLTLEHVRFGSILGADKRPLKTREGRNVRLRDLLDEAESRAYAVVAGRDAGESTGASGPAASGAGAGGTGFQPVNAAGEFTEEQKRLIARRVGIGAVKYADLSRDRNSDYLFSWDQMLALQGNTAPYMLYAYARIRSIYRKAAEQLGAPDVYAADAMLMLSQDAERVLALRLIRFREALDSVARDLLPHILCSYLYDLATEFMRFYEACPVIRAADDATRLSRLHLCDLTARTLKVGLDLLGIQVVSRM